MALSAGAAACLAPAAGAVAPGANGRLASFGYAPGTAESWVEQGDPVAGGPLVPVSRAFAGPDGGTADRYPSWSPDGRLVLSGDPDGNAYTGDDAGPDLIVTDADGRTRTNLTRTPDVFELEPAWSPDGTQIAFSVGGPFGPGESLWVMNADGTGSRRLGAGSQPAWSPDGRRLAFSRDGDIHTTTRGGGDVRQVTSDPGVEGFPTWAPDGRHIAWSTKEPVEGAPDREDVWMARVDGRQRQRLVATPRPESAPAFSPDGTQLAFSRQGPDECCPGLWVLSLASGDQRRVAGTDGADWERRNRLPVAGFTADPEEPRAGMLVTLRSFSSDADGPLASQRWDLDEDGRFDDDAGERASVTLDAARPTLTVRLRVRDADGAEATASRVLRLPAADLGPGGGPVAGAPPVAGGQGTGTPGPADAVPGVPAEPAGPPAGPAEPQPAAPGAVPGEPVPSGSAPAGSPPAALPVLPAGPAARPARSASLSLPASVVARDGRIAVRVRCAAACRGTLQITSRSGRVVGTLAFRLPAGASTLRVPVAASVVRRARVRPVGLRAVLSVGRGARRQVSEDAFTLRAG